MVIKTAETRTYLPSPEEFLEIRKPEKARIFLRPTADTQDAIASFFYGLDHDMPQGIRAFVRRTYGHLPGLPIATLAIPEELLEVEDPREAYQAIVDAQQDFDYFTHRDRVDLRHPSIQAVRYDGNTVLGARFDDDYALKLFPRIRRRYVGGAMASISCQNPEGLKRQKIDRFHLPDVVMPILRPRKPEYANHIHPWLSDRFARDFPNTLSFEPILVPAHPSHALKRQEAVQRRLAAEEEVRKQEAERQNALRRFVESFETGEELSLLQRALQAARTYPDRIVKYVAPDADITFHADSLPVNLHLLQEDCSPFIHIS